MKFSTKISLAILSLFFMFGISPSYQSVQSSPMKKSTSASNRVRGEFLFIRTLSERASPWTFAYEEEWTLIPFTIYFRDTGPIGKYTVFGSSNIGIVEGVGNYAGETCTGTYSELRMPVRHEVSGYFSTRKLNYCMLDVTVTEYWPPGDRTLTMVCPWGTFTNTTPVDQRFKWRTSRFRIHAPGFSDTTKYSFRNVKYEDTLILNSIEDMSGTRTGCSGFYNVGDVMKGFERIIGP